MNHTFEIVIRGTYTVSDEIMREAYNTDDPDVAASVDQAVFEQDVVEAVYASDEPMTVTVREVQP